MFVDLFAGMQSVGFKCFHGFGRPDIYVTGLWGFCMTSVTVKRESFVDICKRAGK